MKALTKAHLATRDALCARLIQHYGDLEDALQIVNAALVTAWERIESTLAAYNAVVDEANAWREEIVSEIQHIIEDHNEKWQESDIGQTHIGWLNAWENDTLETVDLDPPEMPELDIDNQSDVLAGLPENPQ